MPFHTTSFFPLPVSGSVSAAAAAATVATTAAVPDTPTLPATHPPHHNHHHNHHHSNHSSPTRQNHALVAAAAALPDHNHSPLAAAAAQASPSPSPSPPPQPASDRHDTPDRSAAPSSASSASLSLSSLSSSSRSRSAHQHHTRRYTLARFPLLRKGSRELSRTPSAASASSSSSALPFHSTGAPRPSHARARSSLDASSLCLYDADQDVQPPPRLPPAPRRRRSDKMHQTSSRLLRMTDDERPFTRVSSLPSFLSLLSPLPSPPLLQQLHLVHAHALPSPAPCSKATLSSCNKAESFFQLAKTTHLHTLSLSLGWGCFFSCDRSEPCAVVWLLACMDLCLFSALPKTRETD